MSGLSLDVHRLAPPYWGERRQLFHRFSAIGLVVDVSPGGRGVRVSESGLDHGYRGSIGVHMRGKPMAEAVWLDIGSALHPADGFDILQHRTSHLVRDVRPAARGKQIGMLAIQLGAVR